MLTTYYCEDDMNIKSDYRFDKEKEFVQKLIANAKEQCENYIVIIVGNVVGITKNFNDFNAKTSVTDEYYTLTQFNEISSTLQKVGFETLCYFDEMDFIQDVLNKRIKNNYPKKFIVLNFAQKGLVQGRKSLIPIFCEMNDIIHTNSNGFACSFAREKYYWGLCIKDIANVPDSWLFNNKTSCWLAGEPTRGEKVIAKLCNQSSSIGMESQKSVFVYSDKSFNDVLSIANTYQQPVLVQKCIPGMEVEVPIFYNGEKVFCLPPSGILIDDDYKLNNKVLSNDIRCYGGFKLYNFDDKFSELSASIQQQSIAIAKFLDLQGVSRIDYRIDNNNTAYVTDINCNPHLTKTSSVYKGFEHLNLGEYKNMVLAIIGLTISRKW